ncbi:hypothetical protein KFK09_002614 [Dendrobium nobile]|uniref:DRBM domain-containing protein n=1 Tax=Dendrobium nobile TaxID=94219 RepID=A0A8T3C458_DENNO|nr:hypothetical protein KFK09_002614 [Dendrobium nobile]
MKFQRRSAIEKRSGDGSTQNEIRELSMVRQKSSKMMGAAQNMVPVVRSKEVDKHLYMFLRLKPLRFEGSVETRVTKDWLRRLEKIFDSQPGSASDLKMHKNRLQELCHKRMWTLPTYTNTRDGPDHNPIFGASVVVNGQTFDAPNLSKSVKEAQNKAAEVALDYLSAIPTASVTPAQAAGDDPPPAASNRPPLFLLPI